MADKIVINDREGFRANIAKITQLREQLDQNIKKSDAVVAAVTAAASKGVVTGSAGSGSGQVAAAYTDSVTSLQTCTQNITTKAKAASDAVGVAVAELTRLIDGITQTDDAAAADINKK